MEFCCDLDCRNSPAPIIRCYVKANTSTTVKYVVFTTLLILVLICFGLFLLKRPSSKFRKYVWNEIPPSLSILNVWDTDRALTLIPEFTCYMHFTGSPQDIALLLSNRFAKPHPGGIPGEGGHQEIAHWWAPPAMTNVGNVFALDRRRVGRWKDPQFIWVDQTGTNCYYLYWGI